MTISRTKTIVPVVATDVVLVAMACLIPAASHAVALPLYMLNPMLALLLGGMLIGRDWRNGLLLAIAMPLASSLIVGMPTTGKMFCMMAELTAVAGIYGWIGSRWKALPAVLTAILAGKLVYYALKAIIVAPTVLIGTAWSVQLIAVLLWGGLFALACRRKQ